MRTRIDPRRSRAGNTYIVVLWITALAGIVLASYLSLVGTENSFTMRSQAWNRCIAVGEAGLEEALAHLNYNGVTNGNLGRDGWYGSSGIYSKRGYLDDGFYDVSINSTDPMRPVVTSSGYAPTVQNFARLTGAGPFLGVVNVTGGSTSPRPGYIGRTVRVETTADGGGGKGMVALGYIDMNGNNVRVDSYDSQDPLHSTNGFYHSTKAKDGGDIGTVSGLTNGANISVGNANIYGKVSTGPKGSVSVGANGSVGDFAWQAAGNTGIQPGWFRDDMNVTFPPVQVPFTGGYNAPASGTVGGTNYNYVLGTGNYLSSGSLKFTKGDILVTGKAVWWVQAGIDFAGKGSIVIAPGASLKLYAGNTTGSGVSCSIAGNGLVNGTGFSTNCTIYGLPSCTDLKYTGNASYVGTIYAPNADLTLGGGGNNTYDFCGMSVTKNVTFNGHFNFHYDEALGRLNPLRGYIISAWNEL